MIVAEIKGRTKVHKEVRCSAALHSSSRKTKGCFILLSCVGAVYSLSLSCNLEMSLSIVGCVFSLLIR